MNILRLLLLISASQGFIFGAVILLSPFFRTKTNNYLGYSIVLLSVLMLNMFMDSIGVFDTYKELNILDDIEWVFLFPVMVFFYITKLINNDIHNSKKLKWLYVPIAISILLNIIFTIEVDYGFNILNIEEYYSIIFEIEEISYYMFNLLLMIWLYVLIKKTPLIGNEENVKWVRLLWSSMFVITILWIVLGSIEFFWIEEEYVFEGVLVVVLSFFIYWIFYNGIYRLKLAKDQKEILEILNKKNFSLRKENSEHQIDENVETKNNHEVLEGFSRDNRYFKKLEFMLYDQYVYRDPDLSRDLVAEELGISPGYLSQIVNSITDKNFSAYINSFRVEEVKQMIVDPEFHKYSLLAIGLEAGFKSKTTFYKTFKKETGSTPSEFRKERQ
ncbi:helix-turn-helix domain-containing protein [Aquimarina aquimarini]|uniref:helix-turn-helix domain-containing protein n=1 Tax=Aquimarina aquimarini TaxID=1191734 RepID=UPI00131F1FC6|nr:helix-turn-helix domain-containing protein [Aquimarina aquimarini]